MTVIKQPAVAGMFYPADPETLQEQVQHYLSSAHHAHVGAPKALIAPHAGYIYSGPIAGTAYATLQSYADTISRVVILAPSHHVAFQGIAYASADRFGTPLGSIPVDLNALELIKKLPQVQEVDLAFRDEHSIEVQLPFLQETLNDFSILPLLVGDASDHQVAEIIETLWGDRETLIVVSSDLSHYLDYDAARSMDNATTRAIESLHPEALSYHSACGRTPVRGLLRIAKTHGLTATTLDLRNSGDTAGAHDRVVGYGAYVFH